MIINEPILKFLNRRLYKIIFDGEGAVGKTTLYQRLAGRLKKEKERLMTVGVDLHDIKREDGRLVEAQVWDLGGQKHFRSIHERFLKKLDIGIFVFSVEWYETLICIVYWLDLLLYESPKKIYLIGNKIDCFNRMITTAEDLELVQERNMVYYEMSALEGYGFEFFKEDLINTILSIVADD